MTGRRTAESVSWPGCSQRRARRLPILPVITVLSDALHRIGTIRLTGTHALVPLHRAGDTRIELAEVADWFALADPSGAARPTVAVSALPSADLAARAAEIRETTTPGLARPLAGVPRTWPHGRRRCSRTRSGR
ncbi:hypothetical protein [Streptomyces sp. CL12]|uniref:hypothetical protein n=1 Tax=Streptomyces sp. CL12 TaxID=3391744 RepID=UPI003A80521B